MDTSGRDSDIDTFKWRAEHPCLFQSNEYLFIPVFSDCKMYFLMYVMFQISLIHSIGRNFFRQNFDGVNVE